MRVVDTPGERLTPEPRQLPLILPDRLNEVRSTAGGLVALVGCDEAACSVGFAEGFAG